MQSTHIVESNTDTSVIFSTISLIADSTLSPREAFYLQSLSQFVHTAETDSLDGAILPYLWTTYGFFLSNSSNKSLRYAMIFCQTIEFSPWLEKQLLMEHIEYLLYFQQGIRDAIHKNTVDETHLFALYFVILGFYNQNRRSSQTRTSDDSESELETYIQIFSAVIEHLVKESSNISYDSTSRKLWKVALSFVRRTLSSASTVTRLSAMHLLDSSLSNSVHSEDAFDQNIISRTGYPSATAGYWDTLDTIYSLKAGFKSSYKGGIINSEISQTNLSIGTILETLKARTGPFRKLNSVEKTFQVTSNGIETDRLVLFSVNDVSPK